MNLINEKFDNLENNVIKFFKEVVIFLNMGGFNSFYEVGVFLKNMFDDFFIFIIKNNFMCKMVGKMIVNSCIEKFKKIYEKLGGKFFLMFIIFVFIECLNKLDFFCFYIYVMRYIFFYVFMVL